MSYSFGLNFSKMRGRAIFLIGLITIMLSSAYAQYTENDIYNYIERFSDLAVEKMKSHGIPASITLAQGILESGAGTSNLAVKANNHFGIKCHANWTGETYYQNDDAENECFRKYDKAENSYEDHSEFLKAKRYERLFALGKTDYKAWAQGLKDCGYATNPKYPERLITLIEKYRLSRFDTLAMGYSPAICNDTDVRFAPLITLDTLARRNVLTPVSYPYTQRTVYANNGSFFVIAKKGDTYLDIAMDVQQPLFRIRKYNDLLVRNYEPQEGEWVYIEKKAKYSADYQKYVVRSSSESLRSICQRYGCRMGSIMTINQLERNTLLSRGQIILLQSNTRKR